MSSSSGGGGGGGGVAQPATMAAIKTTTSATRRAWLRFGGRVGGRDCMGLGDRMCFLLWRPLANLTGTLALRRMLAPRGCRHSKAGGASLEVLNGRTGMNSVAIHATMTTNTT